MDNLDVLLLNLSISKEKYAMMPPLGQLYIATVLKKNAYKVEILDLAVEKEKLETVHKKVMESKPKIIGLSSYYETWEQMNQVVKLIKKLDQDIIICIGGNGATFSYQEILENMQADYVIRYEGEYAFLNLCNYLLKGIGQLDDIQGLAYISADKICLNESTQIPDLDELPYPDRSMINIDKYYYPFTIITSRGCNGKCIFCSSKAFWGKKVRKRNITDIVNEIGEIKEKYNAKTFFLIDDNFTLSKKRVIEFCEMLDKRKLELEWFCEARADTLDYELLEIMYKSGCRWLQIGLESCNNLVLQSIGKNQRYEQIEEAVKCAYELNYKIKISIIIGHHLDTYDTIKETLENAEKLKKNYGAEIAWSVNTPFPGTDLFNKCDQYGIKILTHRFDDYRMDNPIIETKFLKANEIRKIFIQIQCNN